MENPLEPEKAEHRLLRNGVFAVAIVAGIGAAALKVWDKFFQTMKDRGPVDALRQTRDLKKDALLIEAQQTGMATGEYIRRNNAYEKEFQTGFNGLMKEAIGIESEGLGVLRGTLQRFNTLGKYTKAQIVFGTVFSTAATVGGYLLLNQNADLRHALRHNHQQLADALNQKDAARS